MRRRLVTGIFVAAFTAATAATLASGPARADSVEEFYRGRTVELIIGASTGGGYDSYARLLARHIGRHIPGNPVVVPQNMPGAGSLVAANHLYNVAPRDGSVFGAIGRSIPVAPLLTGDEGIEYEVTRFNWIGSLNNEVSVCVSWHTSPVTTWQDLKETPLVVGGGSPTDGRYMFAQLLNYLIGAKITVITGYPGNSEILLAMERGEVDGLCSWSWSSAKSRRPEWFRDGKVNTLVQLALERHPDLPDVPLVMDLAETDEQRQMLRLLFARQTMGRPIAAPPGVPEERVRALRDAFEATMTDPEFLAEARESMLEINPVSGEEIDDLLQSIYQTPEHVVTMAREAIK